MSEYNIREMAIEILLGVKRGGVVTNLINKYSKELNNKELGLLYDLVYGTLRNRIYIDKIIEKYSSIKLKKLDKLTLNALRLGLYQFNFRGEPDYASVDTVVSVIRDKRRRSFINAILRKVTSTKMKHDDILPDRNANTIEYLSINYSQQVEFVRIILESFGSEVAEKVFEYFNKVPFTFIRINKIMTNYQQVKELFIKYNINFEKVSNFDDFFYTVGSIKGIFDTDLFKDGYITVIDISQGIIPMFAKRIGGRVVGDLCCGLGGKSLYISELLGEEAVIISVDNSTEKIFTLNVNITRLGHKNIFPLCSDIRDLQDEIFDMVILDVPCSNSGNFGRHPEARYRFSNERLKILVDYQMVLLKSAIRLVKRGGYIIYSTCSIVPEECHLLINSVINGQSDVESISVDKDNRFLDILNNADFILKGNGIYIMPFSFKDVICSSGFLAVLKRK